MHAFIQQAKHAAGRLLSNAVIGFKTSAIGMMKRMSQPMIVNRPDLHRRWHATQMTSLATQVHWRATTLLMQPKKAIRTNTMSPFLTGDKLNPPLAR